MLAPPSRGEHLSSTAESEGTQTLSDLYVHPQCNRGSGSSQHVVGLLLRPLELLHVVLLVRNSRNPAWQHRRTAPAPQGAFTARTPNSSSNHPQWSDGRPSTRHPGHRANSGRQSGHAGRTTQPTTTRNSHARRRRHRWRSRVLARACLPRVRAVPGSGPAHPLRPVRNRGPAHLTSIPGRSTVRAKVEPARRPPPAAGSTRWRCRTPRTCGPARTGSGTPGRRRNSAYCAFVGPAMRNSAPVTSAAFASRPCGVSSGCSSTAPPSDSTAASAVSASSTPK